MSEQTNVPAPHYASVQMQPFGNAALPALQSLADVVSIAQLMAKSQMAVPKHLRENPGACLAVTMQALRWNADPFAVANKSYCANDRMAYEAQMFAAVINTMAPIKGRPRYAYEGEGPERVCIVEVTTREDEVIQQRSPKFKDIQPKNSPLWKSDPDQQQGYYTIRTMARRHFPDVVLGIYDPDEMESIGPQRIQPEKEDLVGKLASGATGEGFDHQRVEVEVEAAVEKPKRARKAKEEPDPTPCEHEWAIAADGSERMCGKCGLVETIQADPQSAAHVDCAAETPDSNPSPELSDTSPTTPSDPTTTEADGGAISASPSEAGSLAARGNKAHADPGEVYLIEGDGYNKDQRRLTYKDGARFSTVHKSTESKHQVYAAHPPAAPADEDIPDVYKDDSGPATVEEAREALERPTVTAGVQPADSELATSETATPASDDGAEALGSGQSAEADAELSDELAVFIDAVEEAPQWADVKKAMSGFYSTETFKAFDAAKQNRIRASTWEACVERKASGALRDLPDHADDMSAFRLWLEAQPDGDAIKGTYYTLQRGDQFKAAPEPMKKALDDAVKVRLGAL